MATKLYFHDAGNSNSGTYSAAENSSSTPDQTWFGATTLRMMTRSKGTGAVLAAGSSLATTASQKHFIRMFTSKLLNGNQTVGGGTMTLNFAEQQSSLSANFCVNGLNVFVWRPTTSSIVGYLRDATGGLGGSPANVAGAVQATHITGITSSAVSAQSGDVIICEIWATFTQSSAVTRSFDVAYDGTIENTVENTSSSSNASFIQLNEDLIFTGDPATFSEIGTGGIVIGSTASFLAKRNPSLSGGELAAGSATTTFRMSSVGTGGSLAAGSATNLNQSSNTASGGSLISGTAAVSKPNPITVSGGCLVAGSATQNYTASPDRFGTGGSLLGSTATVSVITRKTPSGGAKCSGIGLLVLRGSGILADRDGYSSITGAGGGGPVTTSPSVDANDALGGIQGGVPAFSSSTTSLRCATNAGNADYSILEILFPITADAGDTVTSAIVTLTYTAAPTSAQPISVIAAVEPSVFNGYYGTWDDLRDAYDNAVAQSFSNSPQTLSGSASAGGTVTFDITAHIQTLLDAASPGDFGGITFFLKANDDPNGFGAEHFFAAREDTTYTEPQITVTIGSPPVEDFDETETTLKCFKNGGDYSIVEASFPVSISLTDVLEAANVVLTYPSSPVGGQSVTVIPAIQNAETPTFYTTYDDVLTAYTASNKGSSQVLSGSATATTEVTFDVKTLIQQVLDVAGSPLTEVVFYLYASAGSSAEHYFASSENLTYDGPRLTLSVRSPETYDETASGGMRAAGACTAIVRNRINGSGGALASSNTSIFNIFRPSITGGTLAGSTSELFNVSSRTALGGTLAGATVTQWRTSDLFASGGTLAAGTPTQTVKSAEIATGGLLIAACTASFYVKFNIAIGGGISVVSIDALTDFNDIVEVYGGGVAAGLSSNIATYTILSTGGSLLGGVGLISDVGDTILGTGGVVCAGTATCTLKTINQMSGGSVLGSSGFVGKTMLSLVNGGVVLKGTTLVDSGFTYTPTGGVICGSTSTSTSTLVQVATGGITLGGTLSEAAHEYNEWGGGGLVTAQPETGINVIYTLGNAVGIVVGSTSTNVVNVGYPISGGIELGGTMFNIFIYRYIGQKGLRIGSTTEAEVLTIFNPEASGGVILTGETHNYVFDEVGSGGLNVGGGATFVYGIGGLRGGSKLSGTCVTTIISTNIARGGLVIGDITVSEFPARYRSASLIGLESDIIVEEILESTFGNYIDWVKVDGNQYGASLNEYDIYITRFQGNVILDVIQSGSRVFSLNNSDYATLDSIMITLDEYYSETDTEFEAVDDFLSYMSEL